MNLDEIQAVEKEEDLGDLIILTRTEFREIAEAFVKIADCEGTDPEDIGGYSITRKDGLMLSFVLLETYNTNNTND